MVFELLQLTGEIDYISFTPFYREKAPMQYTATCPNAIPEAAQYWSSGSWWNFGITIWKLDAKQLKDTESDSLSDSLNYSDSPQDGYQDHSRYEYETDADLYRAMIMIY